MAFTPVADPLLDSGKPARSTDVKQMRDNQADHETRISALEAAPDAYVSSHFARNHFYDNATGSSTGVMATVAAGAGTAEVRDLDDFYYVIDKAAMSLDSDATIVNRVQVASDEHFIRLRPGAGVTGVGDWSTLAVVGKPAFYFGTRVLPITFRARFKQGTADRHVYAGIITRWTLGAAFATTQGVYLERNGAGGTSLRFSSTNGGGTTNGTNTFADTPGTWMEVEIIFTDDPSNQALCYANGALKETFTTNLPTAVNLYAMCVTASFASTAEATSELDIDYIHCWADGDVVDAA